MGRCRVMQGRGRVAWTALVLVLGLASRAPAQVVTGLSAIPNPFSPNGDGILDQTLISLHIEGSPDSLRLTVTDDSLTEIWSRTFSAPSPGSFTHAWAGTTSSGAVFSDGVHHLSAHVFSGGVPADSTFRLLSTDVSPPLVVDFQQIQSSFAPDAEFWNRTGLRFGIETTGPAADTTRVRVLDDESSPLVSLGGFRGERAETTFYWSGSGSGGTPLDEGTYFLEVTAADEAGNRDSEIGRVFLDRAAPQVSAGPDTVFSTAFPETLSGWALDASGVGQVLARPGTEGEWEDLETAGDDSVAWEYVFGDAADADGWYRIQLKARDVFGHESSSRTVTLGKATRVPVHVSSQVISPDTVFANGDEVRIRSRWDSAGYKIRTDFSLVDSKYVSGGSSATDNGDSTYTISYFISLANTRENAEGLAVRVKATHIFRTDSATVWVELRNPTVEPPPPAGFALDRNLFNPDAGEVLTVEFPVTGSGSTVQVYTLMGEQVWSENVGGLTSVVWDGRNSEGETVASGVYLVRLGENVRKVGIVK